MENKYWIIPMICLAVTRLGYCLDCYVCSNQDANNEKCLKSIMTCQPEEEMCLTEVKWGTMPYWQAGADKQFYISKSCATTTQCKKIIRKYMPFATHIWYEDWKSADCCRGDRCNYYIISESNAVYPGRTYLILLLTSLVLPNILV